MPLEHLPLTHLVLYLTEMGKISTLFHQNLVGLTISAAHDVDTLNRCIQTTAFEVEIFLTSGSRIQFYAVNRRGLVDFARSNSLL